MKVRVDTEVGEITLTMSLDEAFLIDAAVWDLKAKGAKEIVGGLSEAIELRPPTTIEKTINLTTDDAMKGSGERSPRSPILYEEGR